MTDESIPTKEISSLNISAGYNPKTKITLSIRDTQFCQSVFFNTQLLLTNLKYNQKHNSEYCNVLEDSLILANLSNEIESNGILDSLSEKANLKESVLRTIVKEKLTKENYEDMLEIVDFEKKIVQTMN